MHSQKLRVGGGALFAAIVLMVVPVRGGEIYEITYQSTTDNAFNHRAHLRNTGIRIDEGELLHILGSGQIHFGGPWWRATSFDMGLISPLNEPELMRRFEIPSGQAGASLLPEPGETTLFDQQITSDEDLSDLDVIARAGSSGFLYIGTYDIFYSDNSGSHEFHIEIEPEPMTAALLGVAGLLALRRRRRVQIVC